MNKKELLEKLARFRESGEDELVVETIMALPEKSLDDEILEMLAEAYIETGEYKRAIAVLEGQRERLDDDFKWHFLMGVALFKASKDEECEDDDELRRRILERAQVSFARGMNMNPPEKALESADMYMEMIEDELDALEGESEDEEFAPEMYEAEEIEAVEEHIKEYFGDFPTVFHELVSPDIHCDIYIVPPTKERNYYTLLTVGMGAHIMDIPKKLSADEYARAELLICLPPDWKVGETTDEWFWPISLLKNLSRLPINCETWLGWGHSVDHKDPFFEGTMLCGSLLIYPEDTERGADFCVMPDGSRVNFFEVIPLYREEMLYKTDNDAHSLLEIMGDVSHIVDVKRRNVCEGYEPDAGAPAFDSAYDHCDKIDEKNLPLDRINGCNHIAIFMRRCIEMGLYAPEFYENRPDIIEGVKSGEMTDLREFMFDYFDGELSMYQFSFIGAGFIHYYYGGAVNSPHCFPADVDDCAEKYFGKEKYNSEEFKNEAYLFMPFGEDYYKRLSAYIDRAFADFYPEFAEYQNKTAGEFVERAKKVLCCECELVRDPERTLEAVCKAQNESANNGGFTPILMIISADGLIRGGENLFSALRDGLYNPFLFPEIIARMPDETAKLLKNPPENAGAIDGGEAVAALRGEAKKRFGEELFVLCFGEEADEILAPAEGGKYAVLRREKNDKEG